MNIFKKNIFIVLIAGAVSTSLFAMDLPGYSRPLSHKEKRKQRQRQEHEFVDAQSDVRVELPADASPSREFVDASTDLPAAAAQEYSFDRSRNAASKEDFAAAQAIAQARKKAKEQQSMVLPVVPQSTMQRTTSFDNLKKGNNHNLTPETAHHRRHSFGSIQEHPNAWAAGTGLPMQQPVPVVPSAPRLPNPPARPNGVSQAINSGQLEAQRLTLKNAQRAEQAASGSRHSVPNYQEQTTILSGIVKKVKKDLLKILAAIVVTVEMVDFTHTYLKTSKDELKDKGFVEQAKVVAQKTYTARALSSAANITKKGLSATEGFLSRL